MEGRITTGTMTGYVSATNTPKPAPELDRISDRLGIVAGRLSDANAQLQRFLDRVAPQPVDATCGDAKLADRPALLRELDGRADTLNARVDEYYALLERLNRLA